MAADPSPELLQTWRDNNLRPVNSVPCKQELIPGQEELKINSDTSITDCAASTFLLIILVELAGKMRLSHAMFIIIHHFLQQ